MFGAIAGDIIGSVYEACPIKSKDFELFSRGCRFTDDSVLTAATEWAIMENRDYGKAYKQFARAYPNAGYGGNFIQWIFSDSFAPYGSWGNGAAMRVSPVGWAFDNEAQVLAQAKKSSSVTHNHPEGIKGAQAAGLAIFLARKGYNKQDIKKRITATFGYDLTSSVDEIRKNYSFDSSCQGTVPEAIICFLESRDYEDAVRNAISLGGDSDTLACITGAVAEAFYKNIPDKIITETRNRLPEELLDIVNNFHKIYMVD
jgi:ADP-ribosylglycohydrolase